MSTDSIICWRSITDHDNNFTGRKILGLELGLSLGDIESCVSTDTVCSTHVADDDMTAQAPSHIYPSPVTSGDMESFIFTNTVCSTHVAEDDVTTVCIQIQ